MCAINNPGSISGVWEDAGKSLCKQHTMLQRRLEAVGVPPSVDTREGLEICFIIIYGRYTNFLC